MSTRTEAKRIEWHGLWWLSPVGAVGTVVIIPLILAWSISDASYRDFWKTPKVLTGTTVALLFAGLLVFMITSMLPRLSGSARPVSVLPPLNAFQLQTLVVAAKWLFRLTLFGYVAFLVSGILHGVTLKAIWQSAVKQSVDGGDLKTAFSPITGVTTLTQLGIAFVVVAVLLLLHGPQPGLRMRVAVIFLLGLFRAFAVSERLALIELVVPTLALTSMHAAGAARGSVRLLLQWAPLLFAPVLAAIFGAFEYSRSWVFYSANQGGSFTTFVVERLSGYYVTAFNNGQLALTYERTPGRVPLRSLDAFWTAPGIAQSGLYDKLSQPAGGVPYDTILQQHANPEFNSNCGLCTPFVDYGTWGGLIFLAVIGLGMGFLYVSFCRGQLGAILIYPPLVTGLFELPRYLYWSEGRLLTPIVALIWISVKASQRARPRAPDVTSPVDLLAGPR